MTALAQPTPIADEVFSNFAVVPPQEEHLHELGFDSFSAYRLWCLRNGWEDGLVPSKDAPRPQRQVAVETAQTAPHDTAERRQTIRDIAAGQHDWRPEAYEWLEGNDEAKEALLRLLLHVNRYMDVLLIKRLRRGSHYKSLIHGLAALAYHHRAWLRPLEEWSVPLATAGHPRRDEQFSSLVRHLLARYEVAEFMDSAWFEGIDERGLRHQGWFIHIASGGNIRDLDTPIKMTRRMAHLYMRSPQNGTIEKNMRWTQVIAMGGTSALAGEILKTRLGRNHEHDDFWSTVVLFLVNNGMVDPAWAGPIVDYISNMKFAPRRVVRQDGGVEAAPPPQADFTMKGRSANKLLRQVETWHGQLGRERDVVFQSWQSSGVRPWTMEDQTDKLGKVHWSVQELLSSWELAAEGRAMHHCVVSYSDQCADGKTAIWSINAQPHGAEERQPVLTVALDIKRRAVTQARGRYNAVPNKPPKSAKAKKEIQSGYLDLLNRSNFVLNEWIQRERLRREG